MMSRVVPGSRTPKNKEAHLPTVRAVFLARVILSMYPVQNGSKAIMCKTSPEPALMLVGVFVLYRCV